MPWSHTQQQSSAGLRIRDQETARRPRSPPIHHRFMVAKIVPRTPRDAILRDELEHARMKRRKFFGPNLRGDLAGLAHGDEMPKQPKSCDVRPTFDQTSLR